MSVPLSTSADSTSNLPIVGYTIDQLKDYILRQLGAPVWNVELTNQHVLDAINDALALYSQYRPKLRYGTIRCVKSQFEYLEGVDMELGIVQIDFVDTTPAPTEIFYGNLISPAPIIRTGLDEYDLFLRWRKTWGRVTSVQPDWIYDDERRVLMIYNPLERYHIGMVTHGLHRTTQGLPPIGAQWLKEYSLAKARFMYGEILMKFSGAIPGPVKDLQLDTAKRTEAKQEVERLEQKIFGMQYPTPIAID